VTRQRKKPIGSSESASRAVSGVDLGGKRRAFERAGAAARIAKGEDREGVSGEIVEGVAAAAHTLRAKESEAKARSPR